MARHLKTADDLFDSKPSARTESMVVAAVQRTARHYFRYGVLFHRADYNLVATTTKTPAPRRMTCLTL